MTQYNKPLPKTDPVTAPFWKSLKNGAMEVQRCDDCTKHVFYPRALCNHCGSRRLSWMPVSGRGTIYSMTIVEKGPSPAFQADGPYVVALVDLDEGCRMMTNIVGVRPSPDTVKIGMPVEIVYDNVTDAVTLPKFRPACADPAKPTSTEHTRPLHPGNQRK
jgi:uncharacterized OB-fold protein